MNKENRPTRRKSYRKAFSRRKNDIRKRHALYRQLKSSSDTKQPNESLLSRHHPNLSFEILKEQLQEKPLPSPWTAVVDDSIQLCLMRTPTMAQPKVERSITVTSDMTWILHVRGKQIKSPHLLLEELPSHIIDSTSLEEIVHRVQSAPLCPGNRDFISLLEKRGGVLKDVRGGTVAFIDKDGEIKDVDGEIYCATVRRTDCELLYGSPEMSAPQRCEKCRLYRNQLRVIRHREEQKRSKSCTRHDSHCNYRYLSPAETVERMKSLQKEKISLKELNKKKAQKMINDDGIHLLEEDAADIEKLMMDNNHHVQSNYSDESFQRILWEQQMKYNSLKDKRQMRWHPVVVRFALSLRYASSAAYSTVVNSGLLSLPSERTLRDYTHWSSVTNGVHFPFIQKAKEVMKKKNFSSSDQQFTLIMDEMKVKKGLVFRKNTSELVGFCDLGRVNNDLEALLSSDKETEHLTPQLAEHMLTFMIRSIFKPSYSFMIASYPSTSLSGEQLYAPVWEVIEALEFNGMPILSVTCDGAKPNRRFFRICSGKSTKYKTRNPYADRDLYFFCDPPHLLKTARNSLSNSGAHSNSRNLVKNGISLSWKHIESLFLQETKTDTPGVRLCPKLTKDHIWLNSYSRMKVKLATQVLSDTVGAALTFLNKDETKETRHFVSMMDRFFDCLNVKSAIEGTLKRKDTRLPYRSAKDWRFKWLKTDFLGYFDEWEREVLKLPLSPTEMAKVMISREIREGLQITVNSFCELGPQLIKDNGLYLLSEVFSQDPVERYFSKQRHRGGGNENPTVNQFRTNSSILVQRQALSHDLRTMNVQAATNPEARDLLLEPLPKRPRLNK